MALDFVKIKMQRMRSTVRLYQWLNKNYTEQLLFKNTKSELERIKNLIAQGEV